MDEVIERRKWPLKKVVIIFGVLCLLLLIYVVISNSSTAQNYDSSRINVSTVEENSFSEYIPIVGSVMPQTTVYLDLQEGGIIDEIYIPGGTKVNKGDIILQLSNASAQKSHVDSESQTLRTLNSLRTQKINLTQQYLRSKEGLLDLNKELLDAKRQFKRLSKLHSRQAGVTEEEYERARDNVEYLTEKIVLQEERILQESILRQQQEQQIDDSIKRSDRSLDILSNIMKSLQVRAPIDGYLSSMDIEIGQSFSRGERIGQVDQLDNFTVRASVDQYYISRVKQGQMGKFDFNGKTNEIVVSKIYPEVTNNQFLVDMDFSGAFPDGIKRGQTLHIDLSLGNASTTKTLKKGGFYRHTNGRWAYKLSEDGMRATKINIVSGRQNPQNFEILEGLEIGDRIITSSYDDFNDADELKFKEPLF